MSESIGEFVDIESLTPWEDNPRVNEHAIEAVVRSIKRFGFGAPIIARKEDGEIIAGHTRYEAAKRLGLKQVPVRFLNLDPVDAHLLGIADNKIGEKADWARTLSNVMKELKSCGGDLDDLGFSDIELKLMLADTDAIVDDPLKEWEGMPEFKQNDEDGVQVVKVHFKTREDVDDFMILIEQEFTKDTRAIWHPKCEILHAGDLRFSNES
jgi:ParB-like chromosome segregation protein Spo0J